MIWRYSSSATVAWSEDIAAHPTRPSIVARVQLGPGTRVLVTGASRGIGAAIAGAFEVRGCTVGRVARTGELAADVADRESITAAIERFGQVNVCVANAGIAHYLPFTEMPV